MIGRMVSIISTTGTGVFWGVGMSDCLVHKRKVPRWAKVVLAILAILLVALYAVAQVIFKEFNENSFGIVDDLFAIAQGELSDFHLATNPNNFDWDRPAPKTISRKPACSKFGGGGKVSQNVSYQVCVHPFRWAGPGCAWWRFDQCNVYRIDDFILTQPDVLGRTLHVLQEPCRYLPTAVEMDVAEQKGIFVSPHLHKAHSELSCDTGGMPVPVNVTIHVKNDQGDIVAQFLYRPSKE